MGTGPLRELGRQKGGFKKNVARYEGKKVHRLVWIRAISRANPKQRLYVWRAVGKQNGARLANLANQVEVITIWHGRTQGPLRASECVNKANSGWSLWQLPRGQNQRHWGRHTQNEGQPCFFLWLIRPYQEWHVLKRIQKLGYSERGNQQEPEIIKNGWKKQRCLA